MKTPRPCRSWSQRLHRHSWAIVAGLVVIVLVNLLLYTYQIQQHYGSLLDRGRAYEEEEEDAAMAADNALSDRQGGRRTASGRPLATLLCQDELHTQCADA